MAESNSDESFVFTLDQWNPEEQGSSETDNEIRMRPSWYPNKTKYDKNEDGPHWTAVFSKDSWINELKAVKEINQTDRRNQFNEEKSRFIAQYTENIEPTITDELDLEDILPEIERSYARISLLYDCIEADEDIRNTYSNIVMIVNKIRCYQNDLLKQQHNLHDLHNKDKDTQSDTSQISFSFNNRCVQAIDEELCHWVKNPQNPRWQSERKEMDEGWEVPRANKMRRYLVDIALLNNFSKENEQQFSQLLSDLGQEVMEELLSTWNMRITEEDEGNTNLVAISKAIRYTLNMFSSGSQAHSHSHTKRQYEVNSTKEPQTVQEANYDPTGNMMTSQNTHLTKVTDWVASNLTSKDATSKAQTKDKDRSEQPHTEQNVNLQVANVMKDVVDKLAKIKTPDNIQGSAVKLPGIDIWRFDGNPLNFHDWYLRYQSVIHTNEKLSPSNKLIYLSQYLSSNAQAKCWGPCGGLNGLDYDQALQKVLEIFADKDQLLGLCLNKISQQIFPRNENDISGIRSVANTTRHCIDTLEKLKIPAMAYSQSTMVIFMEKVPLSLQVKMMETLNTENFLQIPLTDLISTMNRYCKIRERTTTYLEYKTQNTSNQGNERDWGQRTTMTTINPEQPTWQSQSQQRIFGKCIFCDHQGGLTGHKWKDCPVTDPVRRYEKFRQLQLCLACGSSRHRVKDCSSSWRCGEEAPQRCSQKHHRSLHKYFQENRRNTQNNNNSSSQQQIQQQANTIPQSNQRNEDPQRATCAAANPSRTINPKCVLMSILKGSCSHPHKKKQALTANIFIDPGSNQSYITEACAQSLKLPILQRKTLSIDIFGGVTTTNDYPVTQLRLTGKRGQALIEVLVTKNITTPMITKDWHTAATETFPQYAFPQLEEDTFKPNVLIGMDHLGDLQISKINEKNNLRVMKCRLLDTLYIEGAYRVTTPYKHNEENDVITTNTAVTEADFEFDINLAQAALERYLEGEDFSVEDDKDSTKMEILKKFVKEAKLINVADGKAYEVPFLWKNEKSKESLLKRGSNFAQAKAFLMKLVPRLEKDGRLEQANQIIQNAIEKGYYEVVKTDPTCGHHIPTFFVTQPHSTTTPLRHVLGANMGKPCINSELEVGPSLIACLPTVLRRFRCNPTGISADISKAYHQLHIRESDRNYMRILWLAPDTKKIITLRLARVPFGTAAAPFQLFATLYKHMHEHTNEQALDILPNLYSDNLIVSKAENELNYCNNAVEILKDGGFSLRKFSTNDKKLASQLKERELLNTEEQEECKVLGMKWDLTKDTLSFPNIQDRLLDKITHRKILKQLPRHYDPLGIASSILMPGTKFMSELSEKGYKFDDPLNDEDCNTWRQIYSEVKQAMSIEIPRYHKFDTDKPVRLQVFSDASCKWGAAVGYLTQHNKAVVVSAKAKMPSKRLRTSGITVPRRELEAAVLGSKLMAKLIKTYESIYKLEPHMWSDSTIILNWISNEQQMERFVQNRVTLIRELIPGIPWHFVDTLSNPSDCVSRGLMSDDYLNPKHLFWTGPEQMHNQILEPFLGKSDSLIALPAVAITEPEKPSLSLLNIVFSDPSNGVLNNWAKSCQTMSEVKHHLVSAVKACRKLYNRAAIRCNWNKQKQSEDLDKHVSTQLVKEEQELTMKPIVTFLQNKKGPRPQAVKKLSLFLHEGIVRVGGRLDHANIIFANRYPIYISHESPLLHLRVMEFHQRALHSGPRDTLHKMQRVYWIQRGSKRVKGIIRNCFQCKRATGPAYKWPQAPDLPNHRVNPANIYKTIGCDLSGHYFVRTSQGQEKVYFCIFIDAASRHINLEVMENMECTTFMATLRKHAAIYGYPRRIISDRATYFVKSKEVLGELLGQQFVDQVSSSLQRQGVVWALNPAAASHMGGFFERGVGLVKQILKRNIGRKLMTKLEFETLLKEAACVTNSRILTADNPTSHKDRLPITPSHLVHGREISPLPYGDSEMDSEMEDPSYELTTDEVIQQWRRMAAILHSFKTQFAEEWLFELRRRHIRDHHADPIETAIVGEGDLVLIKHDDIKRALWDMGLVERILPSSDDRIRAVEVRTKNGLVTRPIIKLFPLRTAAELQGEKETAKEQQSENNPTHATEEPEEEVGLQETASTEAGIEPEASEPQSSTQTDGPQNQNENELLPEQGEQRVNIQPELVAADQPRRSTRAAKRAAEEKIYIDSLGLPWD